MTPAEFTDRLAPALMNAAVKMHDQQVADLTRDLALAQAQIGDLKADNATQHGDILSLINALSEVPPPNDGKLRYRVEVQRGGVWIPVTLWLTRDGANEKAKVVQGMYRLVDQEGKEAT